MDHVDCTRISVALARKLPSSGTTGRLREQMSHVASTGVDERHYVAEYVQAVLNGQGFE